MKFNYLTRIRFISICIFLFATILVGRLYAIQIVNNDFYTNKESNKYLSQVLSNSANLSNEIKKNLGISTYVQSVLVFYGNDYRLDFKNISHLLDGVYTIRNVKVVRDIQLLSWFNHINIFSSDVKGREDQRKIYNYLLNYQD